MTFDTILESIMHTNKHIRYATIADMQGNKKIKYFPAC